MLLRGIKLVLLAIAALSVVAVVGITVSTPNSNSSGDVIAAIIGVFVAVSLLLIAWWWALRRAKQGREAAMILNYLDQAVRLNLPLPRIVRAIGATHDRDLHKRMEAAAADLERGSSLATALLSVPRMPVRVLNIISAGESIGRLPQTLERLMERRRESVGRNLRWIPFYRLYPLVLGIVFVVIATMFLVFVMPKFEQMFHDFGMQLPGVTIAFLDAARFCGPWVALALVVISVLAIVQSFFSFWTGTRFGLVESAGQKLANYVPVVGAARRYRALADAFDFCADAIEAGRPFDVSIGESAELAPNAPVARKLRRWSDATAVGASIPEGARSAGMPPLVSSMLGTAIYSSGFAEVLRFLARYYRNRFSRAVALIEASAAPVIAIVMGSMVLWLALALFASMVSLIQSLSSPVAGPHL